MALQDGSITGKPIEVTTCSICNEGLAHRIKRGEDYTSELYIAL
jgi:hypothetical protein